MRAKLNIDKYWPEGISNARAAEELGMNPKSVGALRRGTDKGYWGTVFLLQRWLENYGIEVALEDLFEVEEDEFG